MALNATTLATEIKTELLANPNAGAIDGPALDAFCTAIATAVVTRLVADAVIPAGSLLDGNSDPVTGTTTIT